jgi:predicted Rossmann fold nucleotide-binding protein DprA/Smf involved in DNA uptake
MEPLILPAKGLYAGFTGTRVGLTPKAAKGVMDLLVMLEPRQLVHGDCIGADNMVHYMALGIRIPIAIRPPVDDRLRGWASIHGTMVSIYPPKPYIQRNHDIVNHTNYLIACPDTMKEVMRSGTWATVRYAGKTNRVVYLVYPDGRLDRREPLV